MKEIVILLLTIALPMLAAQIVYRLIDRRGRLTAMLTRRCRFLSEHRYISQIGTGLGFVIIFGFVAWVLQLQLACYYAICGGVLGLINAMASAVMQED